MGVSTALSAGAGLLGGIMQSNAAGQAAKAQERAAQIAAATQKAMYDQTRADLAPYRDIGINAGTQLQNRLTDLTAPVVMDQATLMATPGYQFNLSQGLKAAQNSAAARGLGLSGAAIKGATNYATGLADSTYQNQFNNAVTNQQNAYNRLLGVTQLGANAANQTGQFGASTAQGIAQSQQNAGTAQAAGGIAGTNALTGAFNSAAQYYALAPLMNKLTGNTGGGFWGS
ncbi:hypothetical protein [Methylobacterium sp. yr596]|uniref:hypothetical protein n=1 Tax=Methylobacterium sp. yr596 TaxID=1761800 RepID=UPI0008F17D2A|nr:hypothetical protein [Methylobacterium sp. yr596]SFF76692.1 hypothetical protein SAMN04487844_1479 [Methylobacterium sp. yr596]